jgi:4-amino-4-deoxychorismate lyase
MKILWNDRIVEDTEAVISVYDHGFLYGMGLFETFRTYQGKPFMLDKHMRRLKQGCEQLCIDYSLKLDQAREQLAELLKANQLEDAYIRWTVTAGAGAVGLPAGEYSRPTTIVYMKELPAASPALYEQGKALQKLQLRRSTPEGSIRLKSLHYMNNINAKRELAAYPWAANAEGLFLDRNGHIAEGIVSNVFFISEGVLRTPALETGALAGVTREVVLELASAAGIPSETGLYSWDQLSAADEIFITNSIQELVPITQLWDENGNELIISEKKIGSATRTLLNAYRKLT